MKFWLLPLSALLLIPNFLSINLISLPEKPARKELFDPIMAKNIQSSAKLESYIDSVANIRGATFGSLSYADVISNTIRNRFFHGYCHYSLKENWIAAVCGRFIWFDLSAIVIPDDILKYPMAACSQQSIVLMDFFKKKHIDFRKIGFDHHFALEAKFNNYWVYFDPDLEPSYPLYSRPSMEYLLKKNHLELFYYGIIPANKINFILGHPKIGPINKYPAPYGKLFHNITFVFSHWLWIVPLICFLIPLRKRFLRTV